MTLLAIDAGNTRIKWGVHDGHDWMRVGVIATAEAQRLRESLANCSDIDRVVAANVAGEVVRNAVAAALPRGLQPYWVVPRAEQCGVRSSYARPQQLGADRWAALIGARRRFGSPCVVVTAGTTMTVDALSSESIFLGGFIVPGVELMRGALASNTAHLKLQDGRFSFFPDDTGDAILSGALNALAGAVERMLRYVRDTGDDEPHLVLSGGDAGRLSPYLSGRVQVVDNLVLEGLVQIGASDV